MRVYSYFRIEETICTYTYNHFEQYEDVTSKVVAEGSYDEMIRKYNILKKNEVSRSDYKKKYFISSIGVEEYLKKYADNNTDFYCELGYGNNRRTIHYIPIGKIRNELETIINNNEVKVEVIKTRGYDSEEARKFERFYSKLEKTLRRNI